MHNRLGNIGYQIHVYVRYFYCSKQNIIKKSILAVYEQSKCFKYNLVDSLKS